LGELATRLIMSAKVAEHPCIGRPIRGVIGTLGDHVDEHRLGCIHLNAVAHHDCELHCQVLEGDAGERAVLCVLEREGRRDLAGCVVAAQNEECGPPSAERPGSEGWKWRKGGLEAVELPSGQVERAGPEQRGDSNAAQYECLVAAGAGSGLEFVDFREDRGDVAR
jgi:hypothetical protein